MSPCIETNKCPSTTDLFVQLQQLFVHQGFLCRWSPLRVLTMLSDHHEGLPHLGVAKAERRDGACDEGFGQLVGDLIGGDHFKGGLVDIGEAEGSAAGSRGGLLVLEQGGDLGLVRGVLSCDLADLVLVPLLGVLLATLLEIERGAGFRCCTTKTITGRSEKRNADETKRNETKRNVPHRA